MALRQTAWPRRVWIGFHFDAADFAAAVAAAGVRRGVSSVRPAAGRVAARQAQGRRGPAAAPVVTRRVRALDATVQRKLQRRLRLPADRVPRGRHEQRGRPQTTAHAHKLESLLPGSVRSAYAMLNVMTTTTTMMIYY